MPSKALPLSVLLPFSTLWRNRMIDNNIFGLDINKTMPATRERIRSRPNVTHSHMPGQWLVCGMWATADRPWDRQGLSRG